MPLAELITAEPAAETIALPRPFAQSAVGNDPPQASLPSRRRVRLLGAEIDVLRMPDAVAQIVDWVTRRDGLCRYVVTPNVDHMVLLAENEALRRAYAEAGLVLADGAPLVWVSRWLGRPLPERVAGSDLVPALFAGTAAGSPLRVFLLGGAAGVAERAAANIAARWPAVTVVGTASPPKGFEHDRRQNAALMARIGTGRPDVVLVGLGAPKQELWVWQHHRAIAAPAALCIGATIDFLAGERSRAPRWMRRAGLEWLYRVGTEPRRLGARYACDAWIFPRLVWREWRGQSGG
ncbi:MAG TPA: WecB/TagA/CpsF family glycosyltransferase [Pirellulales bacterium]|jgi:N-acetylglucosaminyldiphosphoundecaprenol N-acetyl-beta-D-mannosaminyltransferase|nr:WecB/TagA/CpsF family glycosyltransferase [Pirellulales bacterium]